MFDVMINELDNAMIIEEVVLVYTINQFKISCLVKVHTSDLGLL